jgi:Circularly permuted ATP-grasp type 2
MPGTLSTVGDLFDGYGASARGLTVAAFDEMVGRDGAARVPYASVATSLAQMGPEDVSARGSRLARAFMDQGVTFDLDGEERPFPLDVVPRIFTGAEWSKVAAGVAQRVRALELFLADAYGAARIVSDGLIPHEVITTAQWGAPCRRRPRARLRRRPAGEGHLRRQRREHHAGGRAHDEVSTERVEPG